MSGWHTACATNSKCIRSVQRSPILLLQNIICSCFGIWGLIVHLIGRYCTSSACCLMCPEQWLTIRSGRMCAVWNWWIVVGYLIQNVVLKLLYVTDALRAVLVTGAGCWTLYGCSMGGLSGSIWWAGCHTYTYRFLFRALAWAFKSSYMQILIKCLN